MSKINFIETARNFVPQSEKIGKVIDFSLQDTLDKLRIGKKVELQGPSKDTY